MPIKIECQQCGFQNDLGRVFCSQCGKKMSLQRTSLEDLRQREEFDVGRLVKRIVITLILLLVVAVATLAFWPATPAGTQLDPAGMQQVPAKTKMMVKAIRSRQKCSVTFSEAELNGFLAGRALARNAKALSIDIREGSFDLYGRFPLGSSTNAAYRAAAFSCALTCTFTEGRLTVLKGRVGLLPAVGPLQAIPVNCFGSVLDDVVAEKDVVENLRDVALSGDTALLKVGK